MRSRKEIPYYLITDVPGDQETIAELKKNPYRSGFVLFFRVSRKFDSRSKLSLNCNSVQFNNLKTTGGLRSIKIENTGFKLSLDKHGRLKIKHRDLPDIDGLSYLFKCSYPYQIIDIIASSGFIVNNEIKGSFYYDYNSGTFKLEDRNDDSYLEGRRIGKLLENKKTKLEKGHNYLIELGPGCLRPIEATYFGKFENALLPEIRYRPYVVSILGEEDYISGFYDLQRDTGYLFKDLEDSSYFITNKKNLKGIDLGTTAKIPSDPEFKKFVIKNKYYSVIDDRDLLIDDVKKAIRDQIINSGNTLFIYSYDASKNFKLGVTEPEIVIDSLDHIFSGSGRSWGLSPSAGPLGRLYDETIPGLTRDEKIDIIKSIV